MAWTAPYTAVAGSAVRAADFNQFVRDNLNATEAALAQTPGSMIIGAGANTVAERVPAAQFISTSESTSSTSYADLTTVGPTVTVTTSTAAIVCVGGRVGPNTSGATNSTKMSWAVSGASTVAASDSWAAGHVSISTSAVVYSSRWYLLTGLTPGSNTFTAKYAVSGGTGTYQYRSLHIIPL
jgi:hypothetical protein